MGSRGEWVGRRGKRAAGVSGQQGWVLGGEDAGKPRASHLCGTSSMPRASPQQRQGGIIEEDDTSILGAQGRPVPSSHQKERWYRQGWAGRWPCQSLEPGAWCLRAPSRWAQPLWWTFSQRWRLPSPVGSGGGPGWVRSTPQWPWPCLAGTWTPHQGHLKPWRGPGSVRMARTRSAACKASGQGTGRLGKPRSLGFWKLLERRVEALPAGCTAQPLVCVFLSNYYMLLYHY